MGVTHPNKNRWFGPEGLRWSASGADSWSNALPARRQAAIWSRLMFIDRLLALVSRSGSFRKKGQGLGEYGMIIGAVSISTMIALASLAQRLLDLLAALEAGLPLD